MHCMQTSIPQEGMQTSIPQEGPPQAPTPEGIAENTAQTMLGCCVPAILGMHSWKPQISKL